MPATICTHARVPKVEGEEHDYDGDGEYVVVRDWCQQEGES